MRRGLGLGLGCFLAAVVLGSGLVCKASQAANMMKQMAAVEADKIVGDLLRTRSVSSVHDRLAPELLKNGGGAKIQEMVNAMKESLGELNQQPRFKAISLRTERLDGNEVVVSILKGEAVCQRGSSSLQITMLWRGGEWRLAGLTAKKI